MKDLFTQETVNVAQAMDIVQWTLGDRKIRLYYLTCFRIAGHIRVCAKAGIEVAGSPLALWRELAKYEFETPDMLVNDEYRRSGFLTNLTTWDVDLEGELVVVHLDDLTAKFHCTDAILIQAWLDRAARQAKAWAGDTQEELILSARLTDATPDRRHANSSR